jgi:CHAD domain-containing protein
MHTREELEQPVPAGALPPDWPDGPARETAHRLAGAEPYAELFSLRQRRHKRAVVDDGAGEAGRLVAELSLDEVTLTLPVGERIVYELEIELSPDGAPADLDALGEALGLYELRPEPESKFQRALALLDESAAESLPGPAAAEPAEMEVLVELPPAAPPKPEKPKTPGVRADEPMAEAGRKVLRFHFNRMVDKEDGTRDGGDPEDLHDMRVATRRQRAAFRLFADYYKPKVVKRFGGALKEIAARLGEVRDLDVQLEAARSYQDSLPPLAAQGLQPVIDAWAQQRDTARQSLLAAFDGDEYKSFKKSFAKFVETAGAGTLQESGDPSPGLVRQVLPGRLWEHYAAVRAYEGKVPGADVTTLHALRITGKRLRYALEFFREVLEPVSDGRIAEAIEMVVALQDHLGELHDADVTLTRLHEFLKEAGDQRHSPEAVMAVGAYLKVTQTRLRRLQRTAARPWRQVNGAKFRRILGRAVAGL